ncbi:MAG: Fic/DOC family protein [Subtercola sp.]|nr:Fic/DOC family protein [Subtercola sp.]
MVSDSKRQIPATAARGTDRGWAQTASEYVKRRTTVAAPRPATLSARDAAARRREQLDLTGITWSEVDFSPIPTSTTDRARARFRARLPELIWNTAALEGNAFTLPEVRTLLDGVTVGGRRTDDERQILALSEAYSSLDEVVAAGGFTLDKVTSDRLHRELALHESIESGHFRGQGSVQGGGSVRLSNGGFVEGLDAGANGETLVELHQNLLGHLATIPDARQRALVYNAAATRYQFYFDGNKRTARLLMTGELMTHGFDAVNIPFARRLEYNLALDTLFETADATELLNFLVSCASVRLF